MGGEDVPVPVDGGEGDLRAAEVYANGDGVLLHGKPFEMGDYTHDFTPSPTLPRLQGRARTPRLLDGLFTTCGDQAQRKWGMGI